MRGTVMAAVATLLTKSPCWSTEACVKSSGGVRVIVSDLRYFEIARLGLDLAKCRGNGLHCRDSFLYIRSSLEE